MTEAFDIAVVGAGIEPRIGRFQPHQVFMLDPNLRLRRCGQAAGGQGAGDSRQGVTKRVPPTNPPVQPDWRVAPTGESRCPICVPPP